MLRFGCAAATLLAVLGNAPSGRAESTTQTTTYIAAPNDGLCRDQRPNPTGQNLGDACFRHVAADSITLTIADLTGTPTGAWAIYELEDGTFDGPRVHELYRGWPICTSGSIPTVAGWAKLHLYVGDPTAATVACQAHGIAGGPGTTGTVTATFASA